MAKKKSSWKKKLAKAALIGGALYAGTRGLKGAKGNVLKTAASEDANIGVSHFPGSKYIQKKVRPNIPDDYLTTPTWAAKGGRIGAKGGGIAKRGIGAAYKSGGRVKSMGIAKRGGGVAKR